MRARRPSDQPGWATFRTAPSWPPPGQRARTGRTHGGYLYAKTGSGTRFEIVDLSTGETVAEAQPERETHLLYLE